MFCPVCKSDFHQQKSLALPFCSDRCRQIDLGRWFNEEYSLPVVDASDMEQINAMPPQDGYRAHGDD